MTRTVSKILAIIAMVIVLPLTIVGTAFVAFFSTDRTIKVSAIIVGDTTAVGVDAPQFEFGGKSYASKSITAGQKKTLDITAKTAEGYDFQGWFAGSEAQYQESVSANEVTWAADGAAKLSVVMEEAAEEYVAVYNTICYTVNAWQYQIVDAAPVDMAKPNGAPKEYAYGAALPTIETFENDFGGDQYTFAGWVVAGHTDKQPVQQAKFDVDDTQPLTLIALYQDVNFVKIEYYDEDGTKIENDALKAKLGETEQGYTVPQNAKTYASEPQAGWNYFWARSQGAQEPAGTITYEDAENGVIKLYISKTAISYTLNLATEDAEFDEAKTFAGADYNFSTTVEFTIEDYAGKLEKYFTQEFWELANPFWELNEDGILKYVNAEEIAGSDPAKPTQFANASSFATQFIADNAEATATANLTLNVVKNYTKFTAQNIYFLASENTDEASIPLQVYEGAGATPVTDSKTDARTELTLGELLGYDQITSGTWFAEVGDLKHKVELKAIKFTINNVELQATIKNDYYGYSFEDFKDMTLLELIEQIVFAPTYNQDSLTKILENIDSSKNAVDLLTFTSITGVYNILDETI